MDCHLECQLLSNADGCRIPSTYSLRAIRLAYFCDPKFKTLVGHSIRPRCIYPTEFYAHELEDLSIKSKLASSWIYNKWA